MMDKPIGIFDSGIGGLTVAKAVISRLPNESIIYIGDTARVPYGTRSKEIITKFALELTRFLLAQEVKILVVACNTISATCLEEIKTLSSVPVLDVITPAVNKIVNLTKTNSVGVIGTRATVNSKAYEKRIQKLNPSITVHAKACPLFVPIAEEGLGESDIARLVAKDYLSSFNNCNIDVLHLGCTHFPLLKKVIREIINSNIHIIDSASPTAEELERILLLRDIQSEKSLAKHSFFVTDAPERIKEVAGLFFGEDISQDIQKVSLED